MATLHFHQTTTLTPEQYIAGLTDFGPGRSKLFGNSADEYLKVVGYTQIATIATDDHHTLQEFRASVGAQWTFLSDPERKVQNDLDIQEYTDPDHNPMIPHTLVLKPGLVIYSIYNGYWFWGRLSVFDLAGSAGRHARGPPRLGSARSPSAPSI